MIFVNELGKIKTRPRSVIKAFLLCLTPFAPHIAEEIWHKIGEKGFISLAEWPKFDEALAKEDKVTIAVQVKGKTRGKLEFEAGANEAAVLAKAKEIPHIKNKLDAGEEIRKVIYVQDRILNLVM